MTREEWHELRRITLALEHEVNLISQAFPLILRFEGSWSVQHGNSQLKSCVQSLKELQEELEPHP